MKKLTVAILSGYPLFLIEDQINKKNLEKKGISSWTVQLCKALSKNDNLRLHLITESDIVDKDYHFEKDSICFHVIKGQKRLNAYTFFFFNTKRLGKILKSINPDIIHAHHTDKYALAAIKTHPLKSIITIHGIFQKVYISLNKKPFSAMHFVKIVEKYCLNRAKNIISINPYVLDSCQRYFTRKSKIFQIENPVEKKFFKNTNSIKRNKIILICSIYEIKNVLMAIQSIELVKEIIDDIKLKIVGPVLDATYYQMLLGYVHDNLLGDYIEFCGYLDENKIFTEMQSSKMLLLSSIQETAPTVISEAMAAGLPVVATDVGGVKYMVGDGKTGFVVQLNNVKMMAERIIRILRNDNLRKVMSSNARQQALMRFHPDIVAQKTIHAYETIHSGFKNDQNV